MQSQQTTKQQHSTYQDEEHQRDLMGTQRTTSQSWKMRPSESRRDQDKHKGQGKWLEVIDLCGFQPEDVKAKVNSVFHTLEVTAKRVTNPWHATQQSTNKLKRVIPLPENVKLTKLRVNMDTDEGKLVIMAPFQHREDAITKQHQQQKHRLDFSAANIPVQWKDVTSSIRTEPHTQCQMSAHVDDISGTELNKCTVHEYLRLLKLSTSLSPSKSLSTELVKDEKTGKWKLVIDISAVGFRPEEVKVTFQQLEKERVLLVEARHDKTQVNCQKQGVCVKVLRQEIVVPEWLDGKQMQFRLMENGVLRIQLPCLRDPCPKQQRDTTEIQGEEQQRQRWRVDEQVDTRRYKSEEKEQQVRPVTSTSSVNL